MAPGVAAVFGAGWAAAGAGRAVGAGAGVGEIGAGGAAGGLGLEQGGSGAEHAGLVAQVQDGGVGVVVADGAEEVAAGLVEVGAQDQAGGGDVEAGAGEQAFPDFFGGKLGEAGEGWEPEGVDLHGAKVVGAVGVVVDDADVAALDRLDGGQHPGGQGVGLGDQGHAGEEGRGHGGLVLVSRLVVEWVSRWVGRCGAGVGGDGSGSGDVGRDGAVRQSARSGLPAVDGWPGCQM